MFAITSNIHVQNSLYSILVLYVVDLTGKAIYF